MADRPGNEDRKRTPLGDQRQRPVPCIHCFGETFNIVQKCDDCTDKEMVK